MCGLIDILLFLSLIIITMLAVLVPLIIMEFKSIKEQQKMSGFFGK